MPGLPTAIVATGTPFGIWTMDSRASMPLRGPTSRGTPITGIFTLAATMPGSAAASPATAIITFVLPALFTSSR